MKQLKIKVTFIEPVLGSTNNNPNITTDFNTPAPTPEKQKEEQEALRNANKFSTAPTSNTLKQDDMRSTGGTILAEVEDEEESVEKKQTTVFPRNADGTVFSWDYQWRGLAKEAFFVGTDLASGTDCDEAAKLAMGSLSKWQYKKAVDSLLFVAERRVTFLTSEGQPIREVQLLERPLRATTMKGERICLARSEILPAGTICYLTWKWFQAATKGKGASKMCITESAIRWAMDYAFYKGFGQWRGGGYGRLSYEVLESSATTA